MAKDFEEVIRGTETIGSRPKQEYSVGSEARDARTAGKDLAERATDDGGGDAATIKELERILSEQKAMTRQMRRMADAVLDALDEVKSSRQDIEDIDQHAQQSALSGVAMAQKAAQETTVRNLNKVTEQNIRYIETLTQESRRRIERLAMVTIPDRIFHFGKWSALILALIVLCHLVWRMFAG